MAEDTSSNTSNAGNTENSNEERISFIPTNKALTSTEIKQKQEITQKQILSENPGPGHEKPTAHPEKGTLNQETVDATIKTIKGIKAEVQSISKILKVEELEKLINSINKMSSTLNKVSTKELKKSVNVSQELSQQEVVALCDSQVISTIINSDEITDAKAALESLDIKELQLMLVSLQQYLQTRLNFFLNCCGGSVDFLKKMEEELGFFKDLVLPAIDGNIFEVVKKILEYLEKLSDKLFQGPLLQMIYLMAWYSAYGGIVAKECSELANEIQKAIQNIAKIAAKLADPRLLQIPILLANIQKIQIETQKTLNNSETLKDKINEQIFKERADVDKLEETLSKKEELNLPF